MIWLDSHYPSISFTKWTGNIHLDVFLCVLIKSFLRFPFMSDKTDTRNMSGAKQKWFFAKLTFWVLPVKSKTELKISLWIKDKVSNVPWVLTIHIFWSNSLISFFYHQLIFLMQFRIITSLLFILFTLKYPSTDFFQRLITNTNSVFEFNLILNVIRYLLQRKMYTPKKQNVVFL